MGRTSDFYKKNPKAAAKRRKQQAKYQSSTKEKKKRAKRNAARRIMEKAGKVRKGDGKDVGHSKALSKGGSNRRSNLKVESRKVNRSKDKARGKRRK